MLQAKLEVVIREPADGVRILDLRGDLTRAAEEPLTDAYEQATSGGAQTIVLNFQDVDAIDSIGAGLLIALHARTQQQNQRLAAYGLNASVQQAFRVTYLHEGVAIYADEAAALGSAGVERLSAAPADQETGSQGRWAQPVDRLEVPDVPNEAINLNVQGRQPTGPMKGFGPLWLRTYEVRLAGAEVTPAEVIALWKEQFASFWPPGSDFFGADRPIEAGDVGVLNLAGPAGTTIATGVYVAYADDTSFCFLSVDGHMFGGMITFNAFEQDGATVAQVRALLRSSDPVYEMGQRLGFAVKAEDAFWHGALTNLAARFGVEGEPVRQKATRLDPTIHWGKATNLWQNAAVRTSLNLPVRWMRGLFAG
jgi:anti-anti-sigma factor